MKTITKRSLLVITVALASSVANATNGYFSHGYSTKEKGLGGAGTAYSQDAMAAATNPAGMAFVGQRMDIGVSIFSPSPRSYKVTGSPVAPGTDPLAPFGSFINAAPGVEVESDNDLFLIPYFAYNWQLSSDTTAGISIYGNGGMNTEYAASATPGGVGTFGAGRTGVNLEQLFFNISFSKKMNEKNAFGGSVIVAAQRFSAEGIDGFGALSLDPANISGDRNSTALGLGLKAGYQGEVAPGVRFGASYQSKIAMGEFSRYKGLFAENGDFDIPSTYNIGVAVDVGSSAMIVADIQRINYSDVASISNPISNLIGASASCIPAGFNPNPAITGASGAGCLGGPDGGGFGWDDITIFKVGYQVEAGNNTYRVGYSHSTQAVPDSETLFNILAPAVVQDHLTAGITMKMVNNQELNISGMVALKESVKGQNPVDAAAASGGTRVEIEMSQWEIQAGWAWKY